MLKDIAISVIQLLPSQIQCKIRSYRSRVFKKPIIMNWEKAGRPIPPPNQVKQSVVEYYQSITNYSILIETGTFLGDMVEAQRKNFRRIFSIELSEKLWRNAKKRFSKYTHIQIIHGDSGKVLGDITNQLEEPAVFWLDAHYDAGVTAKGDTECPIFQELDAILTNKQINHVILIDDARSFNGQGDYPEITKLIEYVKSKDQAYEVLILDDIIRFVINKTISGQSK